MNGEHILTARMVLLVLIVWCVAALIFTVATWINLRRAHRHLEKTFRDAIDAGTVRNTIHERLRAREHIK